MNLSLAKLAPPRAAQAVPRARLFAQLDAWPVVWVHGPAGAGKSTLAASWLAQSKRAAVWLRLDAYDRDPATLITYLEAALRQASPRKRIALPRPDVRERTDWAMFGRELAVAVAAALPRNACLVLDDVQDTLASAAADMLDPLMHEVGAQHQLVLLSRLPPTGFERAVADQRMGVINWDALRFSDAEVDVLLQGMRRVDLPSARRQAAGGWAAGLVLLARAEGTQTMDAESAAAEQPDILARYFAQQVFAGLPDAQRELLCQLAPAGDFDAVMVAELGGHESVALMDDLARRQVFVERLASRAGAGWYRIHPLFREYLQEVLKAGLAPPALRAHLVRVARLCADAGQVERGIELLGEAGDLQGARELIGAQASALWRAGRVQQLATLTGRILAAGGDEQGWMHFWLGIALSSTDEPASRRAFDDARHCFHQHGDRASEVLAAACAVEATLGMWDSFDGLEERFNVIADARDELLAIADPALRLLALAGYLDGAGHLSRESESNADLLRRLVEDLELPVDPNIRLLASAVAMAVADLMENPDLVQHIVLRMAPLAESAAVTPFRRAYWHLHAGEILHYVSLQGHHPDAARQARRHLGLAEKSASEHAFSTLLFRIKRMKAAVAWRGGDLDAAEAEIESARVWLSLQQTGHRMEFHYLRSQLLLLRNRLDEAEQEACTTVDLAQSTRAPARVCCIYWTLMSSVYLRQGRTDEARRWMQQASIASAGGHGRAYERALAMIDAVAALREEREVESRLRHYFALARETRAFHAAQFNAPELALLAQAALARGIEPDFVRELIRLRNLLPQLPAPADWPWPVRIRVLGQARLYLDGEVFASAGKSQKKPMELLFWLAAQGQRAYEGVPVAAAIDDLWPDLEADDPKGSFEIALHRLRKLLGREDLVILRDGQLQFDAKRVALDVAELEVILKQGLDFESVADHSAATIDAYAGELLPGHAAAWVLVWREKWRQRFIERVLAWGALLEAAGQWESAARLYEKGLAQDNLVEDFHAGCMRAFLALGRPAEGLRHYRRCRELLSIVLGIAPSVATEALHRKLQAM